MAHVSEYEVETRFIDRLENIGYQYLELKNYSDVLTNFKAQLEKFNQEKLMALVMLASLTIHAQKRIEQFEKVLMSMKADYQEIYDSIEEKPMIMTEQGMSTRVQYVELNGTSGISDYHSDIAQISMAIQKSKYDGSEEKFNEWVVRANLGNTPMEESQNEANHKQGI